MSATAAETSIKTAWGGRRANTGGARPNCGGPQPGSGRPRKAIASPVRILQRLPLGPRWHVLQLVTGQESHAFRDIVEGETRPGRLPRPGYPVELPMVAAIVTRHGHREPGLVPMFPGYLFVRFDAAHDDWPAIAHCETILRLLTTRSMTPVPVPQGFVESLQDGAAARLHLRADVMPPRTPGSPLRVASGPMAGFRGACVECDGIVTTTAIECFGRALPLTLPYASFEDAT